MIALTYFLLRPLIAERLWDAGIRKSRFLPTLTAFVVVALTFTSLGAFIGVSILIAIGLAPSRPD